MSTPLKGLDKATPTPPKPQSQNVADMAGDQLEELVDDNADSTDSNVRYAAYLRRARDIVRAGSRYTAYTSDIGEAFRPVVPPAVVTAAYGISWAYLIGDVGFTSYKAQQQGPTAWEASKMSEPTRLGLITVKRAVFQGVASMALPAFTIHSAVKYAGRQFAKSSNVTLRRWGPTAVGIGIVPFLPYMFDEPVEHVVDYSFEKIEEHFFGHRDDLPSATPVSPVQSQLPPKKEL